MNSLNIPHKRQNILTGEWILVSPHRMSRPWLGKLEKVSTKAALQYDELCYLCPRNLRTSGEVNPDYKDAYAFNNDFPALLSESTPNMQSEEFLINESVRGVCRVVCFTPRHDLTLALMNKESIEKVVELWIKEFTELSKLKWIKNILIFENKGEIMGCSNPHPHGQIWAQSDIPNEVQKETLQMSAYFKKNQLSLLGDYLNIEILKNERIVISHEHFVALVPYWATWPFEVIIISRRHLQNITQFSNEEKTGLACILQELSIIYDNLFNTIFPYSAGMHQAPVNDGEHPEWHWHMHFYPPLLRSATVKKFMVGYELLANPQRDLTPESAALKLKSLSNVHFTLQN